MQDFYRQTEQEQGSYMGQESGLVTTQFLSFRGGQGSVRQNYLARADQVIA